MEKYGFIYIWFDRKHRRYYIGRHWGREEDGYICSSPWMRQAYKHRPKDFRRRVLERTKTRDTLVERECYWLGMIKDEEIRPNAAHPRYYNLNLNPKKLWFDDADKRKTVGEKVSASRKNNSKVRAAARVTGQKRVEEGTHHFLGPERNRKNAELYASQGRPAPRKGAKLPKEQVAKMIAARKDKPNWNKGNKYSDEKKQMMSQVGKAIRDSEKGARIRVMNSFFQNIIARQHYWGA